MTDWRYERKFVSNMGKKEIENIIKLNKGLFKEIHHERRINNIYLDTINKKSYIENDIGLSDREKIRIRWYNEETKKTLEIKKKKENLTGKETYKINIEGKDIIKELLKNKLPENLKEKIKIMKPTLKNSYKRKYYLSADKKYRITIDSELEYGKIKDNKIIIELKYKPQDDKNAHKIQLPFRLDKNSKYINGIQKTNF